jgi:hypothetical protein
VLGDSLGRDVELPGDLTGRQLAVPHHGQDSPPLRLGQRVQDRVGAHWRTLRAAHNEPPAHRAE